MTTTCHWAAEAGDYLTPDGEVCDTPRRDHCTARRTCSQHLGWGELTCARCVGRVRQDIRQIVERAALMLPEAVVVGVNSEAANLAGPAADPEAWSWRKAEGRNWRDYGTGAWHVSLVEDDDDWHPYTVLGRWAMMLSEDYGHDQPTWTIATAAAYLDRQLSRVAQDEGQDFPLLARELRKCRQRLESVLRDSLAPERGAPCPECKADGTLVRLVREYAHWCDDDDCERIHVADESEDVWVCPKDRTHAWTHESYRKYLMERMGA